MCPPLRHHCFDNRGSTPHTGLVGTIIRHEIILLGAFGAVAVAVIAQRAPTVGQGLAQHRLDGVEERRGLFRRHLIGRCLRMDLGTPQGLVGVDITNPRQHCLVKQYRFDNPLGRL